MSTRVGRGTRTWHRRSIRRWLLTPAVALALLTVAGSWTAADDRPGEAEQSRDQEMKTAERDIAEEKPARARPAPWNRQPYSRMLDEITAMDRRELEAARRRARRQYPASRVGVRDPGLIRAAFLHMDAETARKVGLSPEEVDLVATRGGARDIVDWAIFSGCFVLACGLDLDECTAAICFCHCYAVSQEPVPTCKDVCGSSIDDDSLAFIFEDTPGTE